MVLNDFLSRMEGDKFDPHEFIPISFNSHSILTGHYLTFFKLLSGMYRVVTRSQTKAVGTEILKVHRANKVVDPAMNLEEKGFPSPYQ